MHLVTQNVVMLKYKTDQDLRGVKDIEMLNIALICTQILIFKKLFPLVFKIFQNFVKK